MLRECAHAALAKHDLVIAFRHHVFGGEQPFLQRCGHSALQKNWQSGATRPAQQGKILHVARTDLNHVRVFFDKIDSRLIECLGHDPESELFPNIGQNFQCFFPQTGKCVRRSTRLEGAPAKKLRAASLHRFRHRKSLLATFDRAWSGNDRERTTADFCAANIDNRWLGPQIA